MTPIAMTGPLGVSDFIDSLVLPGRPVVPVGRRFHHMMVAVTMLVSRPRQKRVDSTRLTSPYWVPM